MNPGWLSKLASTACLAIIASGCERDTTGLDPVPPNTDPIVFEDNFGDAVDFEAFLGSKLTALDTDSSGGRNGSAALKVTVPARSDPAGGYAGGAFTTFLARDLSGYNALSFWARASELATLNESGLGNDNTGKSLYTASCSNLSIGLSWQEYIIPIPLPEKLSFEGGLFFFAAEAADGFVLWFDDVEFKFLNTVSNPRPQIVTNPPVQTTFVGSTVTLVTQTIFNVDGTDRLIKHLSPYFSLSSSNELVALPIVGGVNVIGAGRAVIRGKLGAQDAQGFLTLDSLLPPSQAAPTPTSARADVRSIYSNSYAPVSGVNFYAFPGNVTVIDLQIQGNDTRALKIPSFMGISFNPFDGTQMTHFHMDVYLLDGLYMTVKLVDFGADGVSNFPSAGDDKESERGFTAATTPALTVGSWVSLDLPLASFTTLTTTGHLAQIVLTSDASTLFVDNMYFRR